MDSLAILKRISTESRTAHVIEIDAVVWYADAPNGHLILHDASGTAEVLLDFGALTFSPGERVRISGACTVMNRGCAYELTRLAVVDNDGIHIESEKSATIHLDAGRHPIRVDWFNASDQSKMVVEYSGPGFARRPIEDADLSNADHAGLSFRAYRKRFWMLPPNPNGGALLLKGISPNFDYAVAGRREYVGAVFDGFLAIRTSGDYTFFLKSDDGCRLFIGAPSLRLEKVMSSTGSLTDALPVPRVLYPGQPLEASSDSLWVTLSGKATRASHEDSDSYLWLDSGAGGVRVEVADSERLHWDAILKNPVRVTGVVRRGFSLDGVPLMESIFVQDAAHIEIGEGKESMAVAGPVAPPLFRGESRQVPPLAPYALNPLPITPVWQVERLDRSQLTGNSGAVSPMSVRIQGVVTRVISSVPGVVLQDETRGIYVNLEHLPVAPVQIGELLEIVGTVEPGEFSPFVVASQIVRHGAGIMPTAIRASREEMTNGSLHSQYVEIEGYVLAVEPRTVTLRTRAGVLRVETETETSDAWLDAVVKMRGCLRVFWDAKTRQITTGKVGLDYAEISIERPAPADLFAVARKHVSELLMFDPYAEPFQRTRLIAQVVHQNGTELCMMEDGQGLRVSLVTATPFESGDILEIAGFPEFDEPSPHFDHTIARKIDREPLPQSRVLPEDKLLRDEYDSMRVTLDAELLDMGFQDGRWTLQLRAGANTFRALFDIFPEQKPRYASGSRLRLTGVYRGLGGNRSLDRPIGAFQVMVPSVADVVVLAAPPWWTLPRLLAVMGVLCVVLALAMLWITSLRRQVARQTAQLETVLQERHRVQQEEALAKERSRLAYDLHDELGAGLSEIGMMSTLVSSQLPTEKRHGYMLRLTDTARRLISSLDEIVWAVNPRYDAISSFASYYTTHAQQFLELASLRCRLDVADDLPAQPLTSRVRHTLFLAFKEALTNVAKHAQATEVVIRIFIEAHESDERRFLVVSVTDDGRGISRQESINGSRPPHGAADGLKSIAERLAQLDGECVIEDNVPRGTRVSLKVPLP